MRFLSAKVQNVAGFLASFAAAFNDLYRSSSSALLTSGVHSQTCLRGASYSLETVRCGIASMASQRRCLVKTPSTRDTPSTAPTRSETAQIRKRNHAHGRETDAATPPLPLYKFAELGQRDGLGQEERHHSKEHHVDLLAEFLDLLASPE